MNHCQPRQAVRLKIRSLKAILKIHVWFVKSESPAKYLSPASLGMDKLCCRPDSKWRIEPRAWTVWKRAHGIPALN